MIEGGVGREMTFKRFENAIEVRGGIPPIPELSVTTKDGVENIEKTRRNSKHKKRWLK